MSKEVMRRTASDNEYLHKDFHCALNTGLEYLLEHHGRESVQKYLHQFTRIFYAPLVTEIKGRGLIALKEYLERIYGIEDGEIAITLSNDELILDVRKNPAVIHMQEHGCPVSSMFFETDRTVYAALCEETPFDYEMLTYSKQTGQGTHRFFRRAQ